MVFVLLKTQVSAHCIAYVILDIRNVQVMRRYRTGRFSNILARLLTQQILSLTILAKKFLYVKNVKFA